MKSFAPGDRVVVMAPHHFKLVERAPQWACLKMMRHEDFNVGCSLSEKPDQLILYRLLLRCA